MSLHGRIKLSAEDLVVEGNIKCFFGGKERAVNKTWNTYFYSSF